MTTTTARFALVCLLLLAAAAGCRRPDLHADQELAAEIAGAWVRPARDGAGVEGFDLQPGGGLSILNAPALSGAAWTVAQGELVVSAGSERVPEPNASRLRIAAHTADTLELVSYEADFFAGQYRRAQARQLAGVVTYLERTALPPDAQVELRLSRGEKLIARERPRAGQQVPIRFELAYLPDAADAALTLEAEIRADGRRMFATPAPLPVPTGAAADALEVVVTMRE